MGVTWLVAQVVEEGAERRRQPLVPAVNEQETPREPQAADRQAHEPRGHGATVERERGFEPPTSTLARLHSTTELLPHLTMPSPWSGGG